MSPVARREVTIHQEVTELPRNLNEDFTRGTNLNDGFRQDLGREGLRKEGLKEEVYRREFGREGWKEEGLNKKELAREGACKCIGICTCGKGSTFQKFGAEQCKCTGPCTCMNSGLARDTKAMEHASFPNELGREDRIGRDIYLDRDSNLGRDALGRDAALNRDIHFGRDTALNRDTHLGRDGLAEAALLRREGHLAHDHLPRGEGYLAQDAQMLGREANLPHQSHFIGREGHLGDGNLANEGLNRPIGHDVVNTGVNQVCSCEKEPCTCTRGYTRGPTLAGVTSGTEHINPILGAAGTTKDKAKKAKKDKKKGKRVCKCVGTCTCDKEGMLITKHEGFMRGSEHNPALGGGIIRQKEYDPVKDAKELGRECHCVGPCTCGFRGAGEKKQELHTTAATTTTHTTTTAHEKEGFGTKVKEAIHHIIPGKHNEGAVTDGKEKLPKE